MPASPPPKKFGRVANFGDQTRTADGAERGAPRQGRRYAQSPAAAAFSDEEEPQQDPPVASPKAPVATRCYKKKQTNGSRRTTSSSSTWHAFGVDVGHLGGGNDGDVNNAIRQHEEDTNDAKDAEQNGERHSAEDCCGAPPAA
jgi:hypothetical protein